jgi:hypothetical protein
VQRGDRLVPEGLGLDPHRFRGARAEHVVVQAELAPASELPPRHVKRHGATVDLQGEATKKMDLHLCGRDWDVAERAHRRSRRSTGSGSPLLGRVDPGL